MATPLTIAILGSGNVATHLSQALEQAGHEVSFVYSRNLNNARELASKLKKAIPLVSVNFEELPPADVYLICVSDSAIQEVMQKAFFPDGALVVHTSGSLPLSILNKSSYIKTGIFYPVQTFTKNQPVQLKETPIALEVSDPVSLPLLENLASSLSSNVIYLNSTDRRMLHLAAVFACNFTNHLLGVSQEILIKNELPLHLLNQLVLATVHKALNNNPFTVQTGPAIRQDEEVLQSHLEQLASEPVYQQIYELLSRSIQEKAKPE